MLRLALQLSFFGLMTALVLLWVDRPCRQNCTSDQGQAFLARAAAQHPR